MAKHRITVDKGAKTQIVREKKRQRGSQDIDGQLGMPVRDLEALGSIDPITTTSTSDSG